MAPALSLLGPPEIHHPRKPKPTTPITTYEDLPLKDLKSSPLNPLLEFFFKAVARSGKSTKIRCCCTWDGPKYLADYAEEAWQLDSLTTLKSIVCLRMMENPNKEAFYQSLLWVHKNHPKTLALNVMVFRGFGWFEDLLEILKRVLEDSISSSIMSNALGYDQEEENVEAARDDISKARIAIERYQNDPDYRCLHDRISDLFAEVLKSDMSFLASGEIKSISFASKVCPSIDSPDDYKTLICESIAKKMFPRNNHVEYKYVEEPYYTYRVRNRLGDQVLIPLREAIEKVKKPSIKTEKTLIALETYSKIFSSKSKEEGTIALFHHCMKLIELYPPKENVVDMFGNLSIGNESKKLPHQLVASLFKKEKAKGPCGDEAAELEWKGLVEDFAIQGKLRNCVAVCDVRLSKTAVEFKEAACISMGLLISELSENPWKGKIFSFSEFPKLKKIEGDDLRSKCEFISQMECTDKVNFGAIYNRILQIAITEKVNKEQMPKRIFVFTYSDFVTASKNNWNEEYKEAWSSYRKRGLNVPKLVFWNLKDPVAEPEVFGSPVKNQNGGMIMTGFSSLLLKLFFRGEVDSRSNQSHAFYRGVNVPSVMKFVPKVEHVMSCAISREELNNLVVLD